MTESADLENELWALGRTMIIEPPPDDLVERVLGRISMPAPRRSARIRRWLTRSRRRLVALIIAVLIIGLALTPPVRAVVRQWLQLGGVVIRTAPPPVTGATPDSVTPAPPPRTGRTVTLPQARRLVAFPIGVPAELDRPDRISVSDDQRVVSMDWGSSPGPLHLDQFDGEISWVFVKQAREQLTFVDVAGQDAVWFAEPHPIAYIDSAGVEHTEQARMAGPCLVWQRIVGGRRVTRPAGGPAHDGQGDLDRRVRQLRSVVTPGSARPLPQQLASQQRAAGGGDREDDCPGERDREQQEDRDREPEDPSPAPAQRGAPISEPE